eukprot:1160803-Pelagomonas_calceolata.AAC.13
MSLPRVHDAFLVTNNRRREVVANIAVEKETDQLKKLGIPSHILFFSTGFASTYSWTGIPSAG